MEKNTGQYRGKITGWGCYAPERVVSNHEMAERLDTNHDWIVQRTGIHTRRVAAPHETSCSLALEASRRALHKAGITPDDLDLILVATSTPDHHTPPMSSELQHALGADGVPGFVLVTGCTGFVYGLSTAYQFIHTGAYRRILLVGVELLSRFIDPEDRSTAVLFGDAAGAVVVEASDGPPGLLGFDLGSDGSLAEHLIMPGGGSADPFSAEVLDRRSHYVRMNGREVFKFATRVIGGACGRALDHAGLTYDDIDWIIPHQANLRIIQSASKQMGIPLDRFVVNIDRYANTSAASIPLALSEELEAGRILPTDRLLLVSFGAGLTWAAAVLQMQPG